MARRRAVAAATAAALLLGLSAAVAGSAVATGSGANGTLGTPAFAGASAAAVAAEQALRAATDGDVTITRDRAGNVHFIGTQAGHPAARPSGVARTASPATAAKAHLARYAALFGVKSAAAELAVTRSDRVGTVDVVRFAQRQGGIPVLGGDLAVSVDTDGNLVSINGETGATAATRTAAVSAATAAATARASIAKSARLRAGTLTTTKPSLWIYDAGLIGAPTELAARPVWRLQVATTTGLARRWTVLVDATSGSIALRFADLAHAKDRSVCDLDSLEAADPSEWACGLGGHPEIRGEGDPPTGIADVDDAYELTGAVYDYYVNQLGRDSIDGSGGPLVSSVRVCQPDDCPLANAFWDGRQMVFGEGYASADDVVGHELTHGVTQHTSNLLYYFQSGAMNESISDVIGELFDQAYAGPPAGDDTPGSKWLIAEDIPGGAIRDMEDPREFAQPDMMSSDRWETSPEAQAFDAGAVHTNSGVGNKAAFLMTDGGAFNGITVTGIGGTKVAHVWYATNQLLTSGADYADMYAVMQQACANLAGAGTAGITTADCVQVKAALDAVEMSQPANELPIPQALTCPAGQVLLDKFSDNFNRTAGGSLGSKWTEFSAAINGDFQPTTTSGNAMFITDEELTFAPAGRNRYAYTKAFTALSSTYTTYLHFDHAYSLDWEPGFFYDGGRVEIDVEGDNRSWFVPPSTSWSNGPNRRLVSDHPILPNGLTFSGESRGWTSSKLSLSAYKGKHVKIRFRAALDGIFAANAGYGWWIDNVRLYQCTKLPTAPGNVKARGYAGQANLTWTGASTSGGPPIGKYVVYLYKASGGGYLNRVELGSTARSFTFTKDSAGKALDFYGTSYRVVIKARNAQGGYGPEVSRTLLGTELTFGPDSATIEFGDPVTISGVLRRKDTADPIGGVTVHLRFGPPGSPVNSYVLGPATVTQPDGSYSITVHPSVSRDYRVFYSTGSQTYLGTRTQGTIKITVT